MAESASLYDYTEPNHLKDVAEDELFKKVNKECFSMLLDIGSGDGHFLNRFPDSICLGIEKSIEMCMRASSIGNNVGCGDITDKQMPAFVHEHAPYGIITSNYVFSELRTHELVVTFGNVHRLLSQDGRFLFTMTNPKTRHHKFPGYVVEFKEPFEYGKSDIEFKVLFETEKGLVDVGIRDYHRPLEEYDALLKEAGFRKVARDDLFGPGSKLAFGVLYECRK